LRRPEVQQQTCRVEVPMTPQSPHPLTLEQQQTLATFTATLDGGGAAWLDQAGLASAFCTAEAISSHDLPLEIRPLIGQSMRSQAHALGIDVEQIVLERGDGGYWAARKFCACKEEAVVELLEAEGWFAVHDEGAVVDLLLRGIGGSEMRAISNELQLDDLGYQWPFCFFNLLRARFLNAPVGSPDFTLKNECAKRVVARMMVPLRCEEELVTLVRENLLNVHSGKWGAFYGMRHFAWELYRALPIQFWRKYIEICTEKGEMSTGWPDVTAVRNGSVQFIEVKGKDKLQKSQIRWFCAVRLPLVLDARIAWIKECSKKP
jgi:hypothetical protein